jgi:hypothetical protein
MVKIQKLETNASFWISGIWATARTRIAKPSAAMEASAGENSPDKTAGWRVFIAKTKVFFVIGVPWITEWDKARAVIKGTPRHQQINWES